MRLSSRRVVIRWVSRLGGAVDVAAGFTGSDGGVERIGVDAGTGFAVVAAMDDCGFFDGGGGLRKTWGLWGGGWT